MNFADLGLSDELTAAVTALGYETPTPIQEQSIPLVLMGRDILGSAQTGTGKTASFTLPMIDILANGRAKARMPRSLILAPTRELAAQVADNFNQFATNHNLSMALLIGGVSFADQEAALDKGVDVLIATPGRLLDHFERGKVLLQDVKILVIDEADRMLDMGFIPDIERIVGMIPFTRQTLFFSATMPPEITRLSEQFLSAPKRIEVARPSSTNENVTQKLIEVAPMKKRAALRSLFEAEEVTNGIIFCNRKRDIGELLKSLHRHNYKAVSLHGDMDQHMRLKMLDQFKSGDATYLIASDVAARGLDIPAVSHVFNFDVPTHAEDYVHRIGRTGRAGRTGAAFTLATRNDAKYVDAIEQLTDQKIPREAFGEAEDETGSEDKPKRNRRNRGGRGRNKSEAADGASEGGERKSQGGGKRRGLLGRNRGDKGDKGGKPQKADAPKADSAPTEKKAPSKKPSKDEKSGDAFEGNMPNFLK